MDTAEITGDIVEEWLKRGENRPTIAFCVNRRHAQHVCERFVEAGVAAEYIDGETPSGDDSYDPDPEGQTRRDMFARFRSGVDEDPRQHRRLDDRLRRRRPLHRGCAANQVAHPVRAEDRPRPPHG